MFSLNRPALGLAVRRLGLTESAYRIHCALDRVARSRSNRRFRREHADFVVPPASMLCETQNSSDLWNYYRGGRETATDQLGLVSKHLPPRPLRVCEWGCGVGRVIRHYGDEPNLEAFGTDYSERLLDWCATNIPHVTFARNALEPPLPFPDASFDFLYSLSVFTHLPPELQRAWLEEHVRVVRPGGVIRFTVHGDVFTPRLSPAELADYHERGYVVRERTHAGGPWYTTYQSPAFVREMLAGYEILDEDLYPEGAAAMQDAWLVRRPS